MADVNETESTQNGIDEKESCSANESVEENSEVVEELQAETEEDSQESVDFRAKYFYLAAEMDNLRKRTARERENLLKFGNEKILSDLVEVIDNLDRTLSALEGETDKKILNIVTGIDMVRKQFLEVLGNNGLERIESLGQIFDPNFHEAMAQQASPEHEDETIINEYQKGYVLNGRLLRPAKVIVVKN